VSTLDDLRKLRKAGRSFPDGLTTEDALALLAYTIRLAEAAEALQEAGPSEDDAGLYAADAALTAALDASIEGLT